MVQIDVTCHLEAFRRFLINSTCRSFIPESYLKDPEVFPEKEAEPGSIYIEAADKITLKKIRDISFINAREILGIIYTSKSGNSKLKWRQLRGPTGRVSGDASTNSLVNLSMSRVITPEYVEELVRSEEGGDNAPPQEAPIEQQVTQTTGPSPGASASGSGEMPEEENEEDFEAADADEGEQEDLEEQEREETA